MPRGTAGFWDGGQALRGTAIGILALGLLGAILWMWPTEAHPPTASATQNTAPPVAGPVTSSSAGTDQERTPVLPPAPIAATMGPFTWTEPPFPFTIEMRGQGAYGPDLDAGDVLLAPPGSNTNYFPGTRDVDEHEGRVITFRARQPSLELVVDTGHLRRVVVETERTNYLNQDQLLTAGLAVDEQGLSLPPLPVFSSLAYQREVGSTLAAFGPAVEAAELSIWASYGQPRRFPRGTTLTVRVLDVEGHPLASPAVRLWIGTQEMLGQPQEDGTVLFKNMPFGTFVVTAGCPGGGSATQRVVFTRTNTTTTLQLDRGACLQGRVVDPGGKPIAKARLLWFTRRGDWRNHVLTDADGRFRITNLPAEPGSVWACLGDQGAQVPAAGLTAISPDRGDLELVIDPASCQGSLRIHPQLPAGIDRADLTARLWHVDSGLGVHLQPAGEDAERSIGNLPAGLYDIEFGAPGIGWIAAGRHPVDGMHLTDLGAVPVPAPAHVQFVVDASDLPEPAERRFEVLQLLFPFDLVTVFSAESIAKEHLLPAGDYAIACRARDARWRWQKFSLRSGERVSVELHP